MDHHEPIRGRQTIQKAHLTTPAHQYDMNVVSTEELLDAARRHLKDLSLLMGSPGERGTSDDEIAVELGVSIAEASAVACRNSAAGFTWFQG